ncbi:carnitine acetyltransferase [Clavulina sp. PMI_390]|nr:carnitine acetyltransferase [Clavulina sp. PMI_390]
MRRKALSSWSSDIVPHGPLSSPRRASTLSKQSSLPRLPVPELADTVHRYLKTLEPLYHVLASRGGPSIESSRAQQNALAAEFLAPKGVGHVLQERLKEVDRKSPFNWLDDTIWIRAAYHQWREPLIINSNWWLLLQDDPAVPEAIRQTTSAPKGTVTPWQIQRAAWLIKRFLDYRDKLQSQEIHPDTSRTGKWFRDPALRLYGATRIPLPGCDAVVNRAGSGGKWVHIMYRERSYRVLTSSDDSQRVPVGELEQSLRQIVQDVDMQVARHEPHTPIGRLTADHRDRWAKNREHLISLSPKNAATFEQLESCLFTVCLDDYTHPSPVPDHPHLGHIQNVSSGVDATNRWFDKAMSLIVESNGRFGMMGEHSPVDALIPSIIADWAISEPINETDFSFQEGGPSSQVEILKWAVDEVIKDECEAAKGRALEIIKESDAGVLWFTDYGIDWIKSTGRLSPDAYIQMALQLAWYKATGAFTATYETASTRLFLHGRTETIRTLSTASIAFVEGMSDPELNDYERYDLLRQACLAHNTASKDAALGRGLDRHLLGLRLQLQPGETSPFLNSELASLSQEWKLSTSGLSAGDRFLATGFGAMYRDGYGINYLTGRDVLKFGIESKRSSNRLSTDEFASILGSSLRDMQRICITNFTSDTIAGARL